MMSQYSYNHYVKSSALATFCILQFRAKANDLDISILNQTQYE